MATIHEAARAGDVVALLSFLDADALALNARDRHSRTPYQRLHLASWAGHADVVHTLCKKHADVGAAAADNMAAIHFASQKGHAQVVRFLLAAGASENACTRKGMTPLHYAIQGGHLDLAKLLIKKGASLHVANKAGKKAIDLAKDDKFRRELLAADVPKQAVRSRDEKKTKEEKGSSEELQAADVLNQAVRSRDEKKTKEEKGSSESGTELDMNVIEVKAASLEDVISQGDVLPPKKKSKVQLSHPGMDQESDTVYDVNS